MGALSDGFGCHRSTPRRLFCTLLVTLLLLSDQCCMVLRLEDEFTFRACLATPADCELLVDIIKHGGYKLSALEIENHLLLHPDIGEVAVCGVEDPHYGELVGAVVVLKAGASLELEALRTWSSDQMADYKIPKRLVVLEAMPRNAMGKVNKKELVKVFNK